jgi:hypothetical protein
MSFFSDEVGIADHLPIEIAS